MSDEHQTFTLTLVRHGETSGNRAQVIQGQIEVPLNRRGRRQAEKLGAHLEKEQTKFDLIFTSNLGRAVETCRLITKHLRMPIRVEPLLVERSFGKHEGRPLREFYAHAAEAGFIDQPSLYTPVGAESVYDVRQRVQKFCTDVLLPQVRHGYRVLVVAHGGVIREFHRHFWNDLCVKMHSYEPLKLTPNVGLSEFRLRSLKNILHGGECIQMHFAKHLEGENWEEYEDEEQFDSEQCKLNPIAYPAKPHILEHDEK